MMLTDFESGVKFEFDVTMFGAVYNRGVYREVRTTTFDFMATSTVYKVRERVPDIIRMVQAEKASRTSEAEVIFYYDKI